ncbi:MAG: hypothetical protein JO029_06195 [Candidatus Eremiobacteraeota bacterium]|nr:hypothetical protein [Candidatus Eremiobacteraeota bacterium]MBV8332841.1 hypothetical protein [Candidatus Eremiobacteraeota bacterium]MBV8433855.1 hypothetical protein [Candidatus Eremiobacteraeota bacterium]MBV8584599.1 hypothetical protein [Candidatus Eremiobacteraeota bacterium]MBV8723136.1 hypothetical protein [Candidatus Eremiobacteraeota bacterium]
MMTETAELWIRLKDGRSICERYNQLAMAEFMREAMIERMSRGEPVVCYDGEERSIPAAEIKRIDLLLGREGRRRGIAVV